MFIFSVFCDTAYKILAFEYRCYGNDSRIFCRLCYPTLLSARTSCQILNLICKRLSGEISTLLIVKDLDAGDPSYSKQTQQQTSYRKPTCYRATYQGLAIFDLYRPSCCKLSILNQLSIPSSSKNRRLVAFTHSKLNSKYRPPVKKIPVFQREV
jgi:hypothetical protein